MNFTPSRLLDLLYPRRCALCDAILKSDEPFICRECGGKVRFRDGETCVKCGRPLEGRVADKGRKRFKEFEEEPERPQQGRLSEACGKGLTGLQSTGPGKNVCDECAERHLSHDACLAPFAYSGMIRDSLMRFKYHDRPEYAGFFAAAILHYGREIIRQWRPDALVPVPVHKSRLAKRGYNQALLIAKELSARTGIPLREDLITRNKRTEAQKELTFEGRRRNISDAFLCPDGKKAPGTVIVVDDIFTTGSTLGTIAEILKAHGADKVYGICVCS